MRIELQDPRGGRLAWIDLLRGISILFVMLWHASAVPQLFDWPMPGWLLVVNNALLPFRMPMLMFLSGLLLPKSLAKPWPSYYVGKISTLVWPYLIWAAVYRAQYGSAWPLTNWHTWYAAGYLWFLFFVTVYYFIAPIVVRLPAWLTPWLFMVGSIPLAVGTEKRLVYFGTFFFFGYWFAVSPRLRSSLRGWIVPVVAALASGWAVASARYGIDLAYRGEFALFSISGVLFAVWLANRASGAWTKAVAFIGRNSIVYYVSHFPVMTVLTLAVMRFNTSEHPGMYAANLVVAIACATTLAHARHYQVVNAFFLMPRVLADWLRALLEGLARLVPSCAGRPPG